tara:strand:- start:16 stop:822 length:807 start_codon:yes stop_codon:yes gene_type:complete
MFKTLIKKIKRGFWTYKQPLSAKPKNLNEPVSDLFVWRHLGDWKTYFDLYDIGSFYSQTSSKAEVHAKIIFYSPSGKKIKECIISLKNNQNNCIEISSFLKDNDHLFGTFAVFHSNVPGNFSKYNSYLTERGYTSYKYKNNQLRHYVHGNSDAISISNNLSYLLGVSSFLKRDYRLQFNLINSEIYDFIIVNYTNKKQEVSFAFIDSSTNKKIAVKNYSINPNGCCLCNEKINYNNNLRIVISSKLIMARPIVFRYGHNRSFFDVFHG